MNHPSTSSVRVRMAPSPTGFFHVGSARTALFNYLFARHHQGTFVLRIEDTDASRNDPAYEQIIYDALEWLGLDIDEGPHQGGGFGPYRQSERFDIYRRYAQQLVEEGLAYLAYETGEELAAIKAEQQANKLPPRYTGAHRDLTAEQRAKFEAEGRRPVVRLRVPEGETAWHDLVHGDTKWQNKELDDFVILKSDTSPTYNFACAVDDALMEITHVIRGEDGLSNTPRQILIYRALGLPVPQFAHLPFLLGSDRSKLSKRHGAVNLLEFADEGILPDAMFNYLALLGWNPGDGETQEFFTREELIKIFQLEDVNKAGAIFDTQKLQFMNVQYLKKMPLAEFQKLALPYLQEFQPAIEADPEYAARALDLARERIRNLADITAGAIYFFSDEYPVDAKGIRKHNTPEAKVLLGALRERLSALSEWTEEAIEEALRALADEKDVKAAALIHPSRVAVSGQTVGPSIFELLAALGRERVLSRIEQFCQTE